MGAERGAGGTGEGAAGTDEEKDSVDGEYAMAAAVGEGEQTGSADDLERIADEDDLAAVEAVGDVSRRQEKERAGKKKREAGKAQVEGAVGNGVDLPGDGDRLRLRAEDDGDAGQLVEAEVARGEGLQSATRRAVGRGTHVLLG